MGNVETQYNIGQMYYDDGGVELNYKTDIEWFREASIGGNGEAKNKLGECYGHVSPYSGLGALNTHYYLNYVLKARSDLALSEYLRL